MRVVDLTTKDTDPIFALVYGASGTGKTHLMGTVGALGETLIIDVDQGIKTLRNAPDLIKANYNKNITVKGGVVMHNISKDMRRATRDMDIDHLLLLFN